MPYPCRSSTPRGRLPALAGVLILTASLLVTRTQAAAPTATSITSSGLGTIVTPLNATETTITGGTRPSNGPNLFHSFGDFILKAGNTANFSNDMALPTSNILARVTGGRVSDIYGTIKTTNFGTASLFLINPFGIVFGPTASLNVGGSVHITTADYLKMGASQFFAYLDGTNTRSTFSTDPIAAFGFLGSSFPSDITIHSPSPAPITVERNSVLEVLVGKTLSLVGGDINITGGPLGFLTAASGRINLASVASFGEVIPNATGAPLSLDTSTFKGLGQIALSDQAFLDTSGNGGGTVVIRGGSLTIDNSFVVADTLSSQNGAAVAVDINVTGNIMMTNGTAVGVSAKGAGKSGNISIQGHSLELSGGSQLVAVSQGSGSAGLVDVHADEILFSGALSGTGTSQALSGIQATARGSGNGANVNIITGSLQIKNGAGIETATTGGGNGGSVDISATGQFVLTGHSGTLPSRLSTSTVLGATGRAGNITIRTGTLEVSDEAGIELRTSSKGNGGVLDITAQQILLDGGPNPLRGVDLNARTSGTAPAGAINIHTGTLVVKDGAEIRTSGNTGDGGPIQITAESILMSATNITNDLLVRHRAASGGTELVTGLFADALGFGRGGSITIRTGALEVDDGATLNTSVSTSSIPAGFPVNAKGGAIDVTADTIVIGGQNSAGQRAGISADSRTTVVAADAGDILLVAPNVLLRDGGFISTSTLGLGKGGNIAVNAANAALNNGALISAKSVGSGNAGTIALNASDTIRLVDSTVTSEATVASGGNIKFAAPNLIQIVNGQIITRVQGGAQTAGGDINIDPQFVVLQNSQILATATQGNGGNITIAGNVVMVDPLSRIDASSALGVSGQVAIQAPVNNIATALSRLSQTPLNAAELLTARCSARLREGHTSSLTVAGRDGVPAEPGSWRPTAFPYAALRPPTSPPFAARPTATGLSPLVPRPSGPELQAMSARLPLSSGCGS